MITNYGKSGLALLLSGVTTIPDSIAVGSGSGAVLFTNASLVAQTNIITFTSKDFSVAQQVTFTADFSATTMSGTNLQEFGLLRSGGLLWQREGFPTITFDGTNELEVQVTWNVY